uniref:Zinc transporter ZIP3 n=1 Tax=Syphacia muris TaxID=451379 RepID=A0A0N5AQ20_9BILA
MAVIALVAGLLPLKVYDYAKRYQSNNNGSTLATRILSMFSCLSGGVFLGVCLLDLLPFASETFEKVKSATNSDIEYPIAELITGIGFFFVYFVEEMSMKFCSGHTASDLDIEPYCSECSQCQNAREIEVGTNFADNNNSKKRSESELSQKVRTRSVLSSKIRSSSILLNARQEIGEYQSGADDVVRSITFVIAFTFHSTLEGFAFGVQTTFVSVSTLFFGIIVHKAIVAFSIGMRLVRCHSERRYFILFLVTFVALTAPIGGSIGIVIQNSEIKETPKNIVSMILTSIALGTFLYITFFEVKTFLCCFYN